MGKRRGEAAMVIGSGSSIAILQERFKQLEKVEKREEKELLQLRCSSAEKTSASATGITLFQASKLQTRHHKPKPTNEVHDQLSLELSCWKKFKQDNNTGHVKKMPLASPDWYDCSEVDTTLHL